MSNNIIFEVIRQGRRNYAVPTVFVNEDGFPQNSRCSECNRFNRRLVMPDSSKTTTGKDGRTYLMPFVDSCDKHEDVHKRSRNPGPNVDWEVWREDYYIRVQVKKMKTSRCRGKQPVKMGSRPMVPHYQFFWVRQDLVEQFLANPSSLMGEGTLAKPREV